MWFCLPVDVFVAVFALCLLLVSAWKRDFQALWGLTREAVTFYGTVEGVFLPLAVSTLCYAVAGDFCHMC